jgi:hypothetical protein
MQQQLRHLLPATVLPKQRIVLALLFPAKTLAAVIRSEPSSEPQAQAQAGRLRGCSCPHDCAQPALMGSDYSLGVALDEGIEAEVLA